MGVYIIIPVEDPVRVVQADDTTPINLQYLRDLMGGELFVERLSVTRWRPDFNVDLWIDEDGLAKKLPKNERLRIFGYPDPLMGPGLVTSPPDEDGDNWPISLEMGSQIMRELGIETYTLEPAR